MVENRAVIDQVLCTGCDACRPLCSAGAILAVDLVEEMPAQALVPAISRPPTETSLIRSLGELAKPTLTAAVCWTGRQLLPVLTDLVDQWSAGEPAPLFQSTRNRSQPTPLSRPGAGRRGRGRGLGRRRRQRKQF